MTIPKLLVTVGLSVGLGLALAATPARAGTALPDGEIKKSNGSFIGHGMINTTGAGQTVTANRAQGKTAVFKFRYENVGFATADFDLEACPSPHAVRPRYFRGSENVTSLVNSGEFTFADVAPGEVTPALRAEVKVRQLAPDGFTADGCVTATAANPVDADSPAWRIEVV